VEARFSAPVQTGPGAKPSSCIMGTGSFPEVKIGRGVMLTLHHFLVPWSRKSRAIPLLPLWAVRPVQSLSAYTRVHFTLTFLPILFHLLSIILNSCKYWRTSVISQSTIYLLQITLLHLVPSLVSIHSVRL